jgi:acetamidase/formamidase
MRVLLMSRSHTIHHEHSHFGWDHALAPVLRIAPGDTVELHPREASDGQLTPSSVVGDLAEIDLARANPVVGPIHVDGAMPGDAIKISLLDISASGWGWTANIPGFGLLADQFKEPALHIWSYDAYALVPAAYGPGGKVPLKPHFGTIGLAPAAPGLHSVIPPRACGGNLDIRDLAAGATLYLPVEVAGGLLSVGDPHAAQGDGEVCGTALESPCSLSARIELIKGANLRSPRFTTDGPVTRHLDWGGYEVTTGIGPDLFVASRQAVTGMIELIGKQHGMAAVDAYMLCSVCGDLRISEIVDQPNWVVSFYFPRIVFG